MPPTHDHLLGRPRRVLMSDVDDTLTRADLAPLHPRAPRGTHGVKLAQMRDVVLVHCGADGVDETVALRDQARRALRDGGFMVKDSPSTPVLFFVIGLQ